MKIKVTKIDHLMSIDHPNGIVTGSERIGTIDFKPEVNNYLYLQKESCGYFHTSTITEIVEETETGGVFKTLNSVYKWEIIE